MSVDLVVEGFTDGDGEAGEDFGDEGVDDAPEGDEGDAEEQEVVDEEGGFAGEGGFEGAGAFYEVVADEEEGRRGRWFRQS